MHSEPKKSKIARFYSSVTAFYLVTLLFAWYVINPTAFYDQPVVASPVANQPPPDPSQPTIIDWPTKVVVPKLNLKLEVRKGFYNASAATWTLEYGYHAYFAMLSTRPNNSSGNTLIYGHNNNYVFGPLAKLKKGDEVILYTKDKHFFTYRLRESHDVLPNNVGILNYVGAPQLTIQTCSGNWNEKRRMYQFSLEKVT